MILVKQISIWAFVGVLSGALSACSSFGQCSSADCVADAKLSADIQAQLDARPALDANGVYVHTMDHVVYLNGIVDTVGQRREAKAIVLGVPGVTQVVNNIGVGGNGS
ncbi:MAG TPA: BON domain-containing protein [Patescibacteria group bacterium]|nr:BON domain-containing protein [Patescibacteria group bacterium]